MESNELLKQARDAFYKQYAQTPEDAGFSIVRCWNNEVVFAKNEQVFTALQKSQKFIQTSLNVFLIIVALWVAGLVLTLALSDTITIGKFPFWTILIGLGIFFVICAGIQFKCTKWENIYLKKDCHLIYNGKKFYAIKEDETLNAHTVFF